MSAKSKIEWTDATWTPIRARRKDTGKVGVHCEKVSSGCKNCYSENFNMRNLPAHGTGLEFTVPNRELVDIFLDEEMLMQPIRWRKPRNIFVCSQTDLFAEFVPTWFIARVFAVMALAHWHTHQVLTKRAERMFRLFSSEEFWDEVHCFMAGIIEEKVDPLNRRSTDLRASSPDVGPDEPLPNVWLGVSTEDQQRADERIPWLLDTPAAKRFVSYEPALGPVDFGRCYRVHGGDGLCDHEETGLDWVVAGAESGPGARPMDQQWIRDVKNQCVSAGVAFFYKQNVVKGKKISTPELDGRTWTEFPA
jgi:protein gp37